MYHVILFSSYFLVVNNKVLYFGSVCGNGHDDWISNILPSVFRSDYLATEVIHSNCLWQLYFYICNKSSSQHVAYVMLYYKLMNNMYNEQDVQSFSRFCRPFTFQETSKKRWQDSKRALPKQTRSVKKHCIIFQETLNIFLKKKYYELCEPMRRHCCCNVSS